MTGNWTDAQESRALELLDQALDQPAEAREEWLARNIPDDGPMLARVRSLLSAADGDDLAITGGAAGTMFENADAPAPTRIGQYKIERLVGRGGMGAVYLGKRDAGDFEHEAAIKVVRGLKASPRLTERLRLERQTLAGLKHPNIAQLFDGGETENGDPYFVMEYVDGRPLREVIAARDLSFATAMDVFKDVAGAVQYAHQQFVVHRDLSPGNIMVTSDGRGKLIDFGISQSFSDESHTPTVQYTLTKGYAAPERLAGEAATVLSDVYALGVILAEMTVGHDVPRRQDFAAILDKAQAKAPGDRYSTVAAFLDDVVRHENALAVTAYQGGLLYPLRRFIGRHPFSVSAAGLGMAGLVGALAVMSVLFVRAERAEAAADQRFQEVRELARFMIYDLYSDLDLIAGTTAIREKVTVTARDYLDGLAANSSDVPHGLKLEIANGYRRLGDVLGNPMSSNLGKTEEAGVLLARAYGELQDLVQAQPTDEKTLRGAAQGAYAYSVYAFIALDDNQQALDLAAASAAYFERLIALPASTLSDQRELLGARVQMADAMSYLGRGEEAIALHTSIVAQIDELSAANPTDINLKRNSATARTNLANAHYQLYDVGAPEIEVGLGFANEAMARSEALMAEVPDQADDIEGFVLTGALFEKGRLEQLMEDEAAAATTFRRARQIAEKFVVLDPDDTELNRRRLIFLEHEASSLAYSGETDRAVSALNRALVAREGLYAEEPSNAGYLGSLAQTSFFIADVLSKAERWEEACVAAIPARGYYDDMDTRGTLSPYHREEIIPDLVAIEQKCSP